MPLPAELFVQDATAVGPVLIVLQVVAVQALALVAGPAVQEATPTGPVGTLVQFVAV